MEEDKNTEQSPSLEPSADETQSSSLESGGSSDQSGQPIASSEVSNAPASQPPKKPGGIKAFFHKINLYLLIFILLVLVGAIVVAVNFLNSQKTPEEPNIATQSLTQSQLKQLADTNSSVGTSGQTLTIQGSAIINGQELVKGDLSVAGSLKLAGNITAQDITASGNANLAQTQVQKLQVASSLIVKGNATFQQDLNVAGSASFKGPVTANQLSVTNLTISGNGQLRVPNHVSFPGASPAVISISHSVLGGAGGASVSGSDTSGTVNVNTSSGTNAGCFITVRFSQPFGNDPHVIVTPIGDGAGHMDFYVNRSRTQMSLCSSNAPPTFSRFAFDYFISD